MKLLTKVAIGSVAGIAALATLGNVFNSQMLALCNSGDVASCHSVYDGSTVKKSMITNEEYFAIMKIREAEEAAKQQAEQAAKAPKLTNYEVCLKTQQDLIEFGGDPSKMDCEAVKNYRTPAQRIAAAGGQTQLIRGCEDILKPVLNDPNSYRYTSGHIFASTDKELNITVRYTATNAFGGRVQGTYNCTTQA